MRNQSGALRRGASLLGIALALALGFASGVARADGTETLGAPGIALANGNGIVHAGVGLEEGQPRNLVLDVPAGVTIEQVLLYWSHETILGGDATIQVAGTDVTGTQIGGPAFFFDFFGQPVVVYGFRADVTDLGLVSVGNNVLSVGGLDTQVSDPGTGAHGVGVLVVTSDGGPQHDIDLVDGVDLAYCAFPEPRRSTVPQTFAVTPVGFDRDAELVLLLGSIGENRGTEIRFAFDVGGGFSLFDAVTGAERLFEAVKVPFTVPADAAAVTVSVQSSNESGACPGDPMAASVTWLAGAVSVPLPDEPMCGDGILDEGEECDDGNEVNTDGCRNDCTLPFCGDGILDRNEICDDGNDLPGDGCSPQCMREVAEGCTPGYWKQRHHFDSWVGASPSDEYGETFGVALPYELALKQALKANGGGIKALFRHSTAAYLNALNPDVAFPLTPADVIAAVQAALASGKYEATKDTFEKYNEAGCPLR